MRDDAPSAKTRKVKFRIWKIAVCFISAMVFLLGIMIMLYPSMSDYINKKNQTRAAEGYQQVVTALSEAEYKKHLDDARRYNARLLEISENAVSLAAVDYEKIENYWDLLNIDGNYIMGYVEIPSLDIYVPIYHTGNENSLSAGAGHIEGTSLPVGGEGTHTVISAHTGLPSARFFDGIDRLEKGDLFHIYVMNEIFTYQVEESFVVEPDDSSKLMIERGRDLATLLTCTPYGINSHRLLVRAFRTEMPEGVGVSAASFPEKSGGGAENKSGFTDKIIAFFSRIFEAVLTGMVGIVRWLMNLIGVDY